MRAWTYPCCGVSRGSSTCALATTVPAAASTTSTRELDVPWSIAATSDAMVRLTPWHTRGQCGARRFTYLPVPSHLKHVSNRGQRPTLSINRHQPASIDTNTPTPMSSLLSSTFKDKTRAARAVGSELETAVIKATNHDPVPPKRKHVASTCAPSAAQQHREGTDACTVPRLGG